MNKFYVYTAPTIDPRKRKCFYVDQSYIEHFAKNEFKPGEMEYSGVIIEADTPSDAHEVYNTFKGGEIILADEPLCTLIKKVYPSTSIQEALDKTELDVANLTINMIAKSISLDLIRINDRLSILARIQRLIIKHNLDDIDVRKIYHRLKIRYIQQLKNNTYNPKGPSLE